MARTLTVLLLALAAVALIAVACNEDSGFLTDEGAPEATGTPPFFQRTALPSPEPSPATSPTPPPAEGTPGFCGDTYIVQEGDIPVAIAEKCGVDVDDLLELNGIDDPTSLSIGQELKIPQSTEVEE